MSSEGWRSICCLALLLCLGCAEPEPQLFPATGTVFYNSQPIPKAQLVFHPQFEGPGWMPVGVVDEFGAYEVSTKLPGDGALPGRYFVTVVWRPDADDEEAPNKLPERYADPKTSKLEVVVGPDSIALPPLNLSDTP